MNPVPLSFDGTINEEENHLASPAVPYFDPQNLDIVNHKVFVK